MIYDSNRVPGQLMPVGAHWWGNEGRPLNALKTAPNVSGLGGPLAVSGVGGSSLGLFGYDTPVLDFAVNAGMGYLVGAAIGEKRGTLHRDALVGALAGGFFGLPGVAVVAGIALGGIDKAKAYAKRR